MTEQTICYEPLVGSDGDPCAVYCKGHVDQQKFCDIVNQEEQRYDDDIVRPEQVQHVYARFIPRQFGDCETVFEIVDGPARGAFKATYVDYD